MDSVLEDVIALHKEFHSQPLAYYCYIIKLNINHSTDVQETTLVVRPNSQQIYNGLLKTPYKLGRTKDPSARIIAHGNLHPEGYIALYPFDNFEDSCTFEKIMIRIAERHSLRCTYKKSREVILAAPHAFTEFIIQCTHYYSHYINTYKQQIPSAAVRKIRNILYRANVCTMLTYDRRYYLVILDCWLTIAVVCINSINSPKHKDTILVNRFAFAPLVIVIPCRTSLSSLFSLFLT